MKFKLFLIFCLVDLIAPSVGSGQQYYGSFVPPPDRTPYHLILTINNEDGFYLNKEVNLVDQVTIVNGEKVLGSPYLFSEWLQGHLTTTDGRSYQYPVKYNAYDHTVSFFNGTDSLVADDIREFTLTIAAQDSLITCRFINGSQFARQKAGAYYEVILDCAKGELLKELRKNINEVTDGLLASKGKKFFNLQTDYSFYDKTSKRLLQIELIKVKILKTLKVSDQEAINLKVDTFDFSKERDLILFFKSYCAL